MYRLPIAPRVKAGAALQVWCGTDLTNPRTVVARKRIGPPRCARSLGNTGTSAFLRSSRRSCVSWWERRCNTRQHEASFDWAIPVGGTPHRPAGISPLGGGAPQIRTLATPALGGLRGQVLHFLHFAVTDDGRRWSQSLVRLRAPRAAPSVNKVSASIRLTPGSFSSLLVRDMRVPGA
jgi:hypothetical protein